jgi:DNA-binding XRE family transcriptional regulator
MDNDALILQDVRAYFGLRQRELAPWLGLSLSQLANIEAGLDALPRHARPWLHPWIMAQLAAPIPATGADAPVPVPVAPELTGPAVLLARLAECYFQAGRLGRQLASRQARLRTWQACLAAGPRLLAALPLLGTAPEPLATGRRRRWLSRLLEEATDALAPEADTGPSAEALLAARHSAWLHEAAWLEAYLTPAPLSRGEGEPDDSFY